MTDVSMEEPGTERPLILERLSDLDNQDEFLAHYPDIRGWSVINPRDDEVGMVEDLYVNPRDRQVEMAAIDFTPEGGYGGKRVLVPVEELQVLDGKVRVLPQEERVRLSPEFHEGAPMYEPYYQYWSSKTVGPSEELGEGFIRPPGRLELEGEEEMEEEEIEETRISG